MTSYKRALVYSLVIISFIVSVPSTVSAASYNLTSDKETFVIGGTFSVDVKVESSDVGINAAQATITYPKDIVQVTGIDKSSSAFDFWLQGPSYSNETGEVNFIGGSQSGISGKALEVLRVTFKVKGSGTVGIIFSDGAVTASDGSGTNVLSAMNGLQLTSITTKDATLIKPPQIVRPTVAASGLPAKPSITVPLYPDPNSWYANISKFIVQLDLPREITDVATAINQQPAFDPSTSEGLFNNKTFSPLSDGIWYLHVRFKNSAGWGPTVHYRIGIDSAPPISFNVTSPDGLTTANVAPSIAFKTNDQPSGINRYQILVDNELATTTTLTNYTLLPQSGGKHSIVVQAIDKAGNMTESRIAITVRETPLITIAGIRITQFWFFISTIFAILLGGAVGWYIGRKQKEQRMRKVIIAERDVQTAFSVVEKSVEDLLKKLKDKTIAQKEATEMKLVLKRIAETIEKNKQYVVQNIEEIES